MSNEKIKSIRVIVAVSAAAVCTISIFFSYRVYISTRELAAEQRAELSALRQSYEELEKKVASQSYFQNKSSENNFSRSALKKSPLALGVEDVPASDQRKKIQRLEQIVNSTGLDQLAYNEDLDPTILSKLYEEYALQDMVRNHHEQNVARNRELHQLDQNQYNEELMALYDRARLRRRGEGNAEDRDKAFYEMIDKYPDAYATGMVIAERGLRSAFRRDSKGVEEYYSMLRENDKFSDIVTDRGTEAIPNLENYLAYRYIREGRVEEARVLIDSLESKYANALVLTRGADRRFRWIPAFQAAENLRMIKE